MILAISSDVWVPAVSGMVGALVGSGASLLGAVISGSQQEKRRRAEREAAKEDRSMQLAQEQTEQAASALSESFSFLHAIESELNVGGQSAEQITQRWLPLRDKLFVVGASYPHSETAKAVLALVGTFTGVVRWFEQSLAAGGSGREEPSPVDEALTQVMDILNQVREDQGRERVVFSDGAPGER